MMMRILDRLFQCNDMSISVSFTLLMMDASVVDLPLPVVLLQGQVHAFSDTDLRLISELPAFQDPGFHQ